MTANPTSGRPTAARWPLRLLFVLWGVVLAGFGAGAGILQYLGPPDRPGPKTAEVRPATPPPVTLRLDLHQAAVAVAPAVAPPSPGTIPPPEPALQEASALYQGGWLPRIGAGGRTPAQAYAAPFDPADPRPRVAVLLAGIGMNAAESLAAIAALPAPVSLAVSPYLAAPDPVLDSARRYGHETLVSLPMEPQGYPLNDPGNRALLTGASPAANAQRLEWALTRFAGYVGATGALGELRGERFAAATDQMAPLLGLLADHGLLYVDPRPNLPRPSGLPALRGAGRAVNIVLDDPPGRAEIDRNLAQLEQLARDRGAAIGLAGRPSPLNVDRIAAWASVLATHGLALAPVSVVVQMPQATSVSFSSDVRTDQLR